MKFSIYLNRRVFVMSKLAQSVQIIRLIVIIYSPEIGAASVQKANIT